MAARKHPSTANSVAPSIIAAVMIMAVLMFPDASGWRAMDSTALPPIRPMPAAPPITANAAPIAPPRFAAVTPGNTELAAEAPG